MRNRGTEVVFESFLSDGRVQGIEGERIRTPVSGRDDLNIDVQSLVHGVQIDKAGAAVNYCVNRRSDVGGWEFERMAYIYEEAEAITMAAFQSLGKQFYYGPDYGRRPSRRIDRFRESRGTLRQALIFA